LQRIIALPEDDIPRIEFGGCPMDMKSVELVLTVLRLRGSITLTGVSGVPSLIELGMAIRDKAAAQEI
jgi:hypothetical protein